jgi:hypothetical protein
VSLVRFFFVFFLIRVSISKQVPSLLSSACYYTRLPWNEWPFASSSPSEIRNYGEHRDHGEQLSFTPSTISHFSWFGPSLPAIDRGPSNSMENGSTLADLNHISPPNYDSTWCFPGMTSSAGNSENLGNLSVTGSWVNTASDRLPPMHSAATEPSSEQPGAHKCIVQKEIQYPCCHKCKRRYNFAHPLYVSLEV